MPSPSLASLIPLPPGVLEKLDAMLENYRALEARLADPNVLVDHKAVRELSIRRAALAPAAAGYESLLHAARQAEELSALLASNADPDLAALAREELPLLKRSIADLTHSVTSALVTSDDLAVASVILEVRAGTGGDEAALWARDLWDMYAKLAARKSWSFELMDFVPETSAGGLRSAMATLRGEAAWSCLAFEAGVHSVKRVPATEAQGRIHTSTATVAVLPEPQEIQVQVDWANDVVEHLTTAQGPGGQNVNKVTTACHLVHSPTGIEVRMQESKSLQQNREKARRLLLARLYELERRKAHEQRSAARRSQIGSGERSEKIRTYRYKDGIVADERLPAQYPLRDILAGDLDALFTDLRAQETARRLEEL